MQISLYFQSIVNAMLQIFILGAVGFVLVRKKVITPEGLTALTRLLIEVVFPALIFWQILTKFSFSSLPNWWMFSLSSIAMTGLGAGVGWLLGQSSKDPAARRELVSLIGFQNSGYLPLTLLAWITPQEDLSTILLYLFMFLLGFNLLIWSWGVYFLSSHKAKCFSFGSLFSPPVIATLAGFACVLLKLNALTPQFILLPLEALGHCSFPLAILVVGANLAELYTNKPLNLSIIWRLVLGKLIILPLIGLVMLKYFEVPYLVSLLLLLELSMPSATTLTVIARRNRAEEKVISQGVLVTHILSLITVPFFLILFNRVVGR